MNLNVYSQNNDGISPSTSLSNACGFKMGCLNINSLTKHIDEVRIIMNGGIFDILALNETKLDQFDEDSQIDIPGYLCV